MLLIDLKDNGMHIASRWELTYAASWDQICNAGYSLFDYYDSIEYLIFDKPLKLTSKDDVLKISESMNLTVRGVSKILKVPVSITFYNQINAVSVTVLKMSPEFEKNDYRSFNISMGHYLDSIEIQMHRKPREEK